MAGRTQIRESRGGHRVAPGGKNRRPNIKVLAFLLLAVYCMAGAATGVYLSRQRVAPVSQQRPAYEANVVSGDIPGETREQRRKELDSVMEEGTLAMSVDVTPLGKTAGADRLINWMIENPSNQEKLTHTETTCNDTGGKILETGTIHPGNYLESGPLLTPPPAGEYDCTAILLTYQRETETLMRQAAVKVKLVLQE